MANKNWLDNLVIEPVTTDPSDDMARLDSFGIEVVNLSQSIVRLDTVHVMVVWEEGGMAYTTHTTAVDAQADSDGVGKSGWIRWQRRR